MTSAQNQKPKGLNFYLLPGVNTDQLSGLDLKKLKPQGAPLIAESEILSYQRDNHEFQIDYRASKRIRKINDLGGTKAFGVFVGDDAIYVGAFWKSILSSSFDGVIIDTSKAVGTQPYYSSSDYPFLTLETGYPSANFFRGADPRSDKRIFEALEKAGLLYEFHEVAAKCRKIVGTGKRHMSWVFTFDLDTTSGGVFPEKTDSFELFADFGGSKMISLLKGGDELRTGDDPEGAFDRSKEILIKYSVQVGKNPPRIMVRDFWAK